MRVRYGDLSASELALRDRALGAAREAWRCLRDGDRGAAQQLLGSADARITLELSELDAGACVAELVALEPCAWPLAELMLAEAPADVGYLLSLGRAPVPLEQALAEVANSHAIDLARASVRAGFGRGHLLSVTLGVPGGNGSENEQNAAENLVRALLGDRWFELWIGDVQVTSAPRRPSLRVFDPNAPRHELTLRELFDTVAAASLGVLRGLPPHRPRGASRADFRGSVPDTGVEARDEWTLLEVEPLAQAGALDKSDLVLATSSTPELLRCYLEGAPCASRRFTRDGERFVYVAYADEVGSMEQRVAKRTVIERALSGSATDAWAVTGLGLGIKSTYLDLILFNVEMALPGLISRLRRLELPADSCIRFFDSELADEWVSIWPDTAIVGV